MTDDLKKLAALEELWGKSFRICNRCGRNSVCNEGEEDRMTQPDGNPCGGKFVAVDHKEGP